MAKDRISDIRDNLRTALRLAYAELRRRGYSPDAATSLLQRMVTGLMQHLDAD